VFSAGGPARQRQAARPPVARKLEPAGCLRIQRWALARRAWGHEFPRRCFWVSESAVWGQSKQLDGEWAHLSTNEKQESQTKECEGQSRSTIHRSNTYVHS